MVVAIIMLVGFLFTIVGALRLRADHLANVRYVLASNLENCHRVKAGSGLDVAKLPCFPKNDSPAFCYRAASFSVRPFLRE